VKVAQLRQSTVGGYGVQVDENGRELQRSGDAPGGFQQWANWSPCPGCPKCEPNDGLVLRRGSWRPTSAYEFVFMFAKSSSYWCDGEGVREENAPGSAERYAYGFNKIDKQQKDGNPYTKGGTDETFAASGRNLRNVFVINPAPFPDAHFATYPEALVEPLIKCSTSDRGVCPECGSQWARVIDTERVATRPTDTPYKDTAPEANKDHGRHVRESTTLGWRPTCGHGLARAIPATILDPFLGSGTTLLTARKLGRHGIGIELSPEYADMARKRIGEYAPLFS